MKPEVKDDERTESLRKMAKDVIGKGESETGVGEKHYIRKAANGYALHSGKDHHVFSNKEELIKHLTEKLT